MKEESKLSAKFCYLMYLAALTCCVSSSASELDPASRIWTADEQQEGLEIYNDWHCRPLQVPADACSNTGEASACGMEIFWQASFMAEDALLYQREGLLCNGSAAKDGHALWRFNRALSRRKETATVRNYLVSRNLQGSGGFGSKMRGIANTYLWALLTDRNFVVDFHYPHPLSEVFEPAVEDWRPESHFERVEQGNGGHERSGGYAEEGQHRGGGGLTDYGDDVLFLDLEDMTEDCDTLRAGDLNERWQSATTATTATTVVCDGCSQMSGHALVGNPSYRSKLGELGILPFIDRCAGPHSGVACPKEGAGSLQECWGSHLPVCWREFGGVEADRRVSPALLRTSKLGCDLVGPWIGRLLNALLKPSPALLQACVCVCVCWF